MSQSSILNQAQIISGRDIPLKELLYAKRVFDNYTAIAAKNTPLELIAEIKEAVKGVEYFTTENDPCEARNVLSVMFKKIDTIDTFEQFYEAASDPVKALEALIEDRAQLIKSERELLLRAGYDVSKI